MKTFHEINIQLVSEYKAMMNAQQEELEKMHDRHIKMLKEKMQCGEITEKEWDDLETMECCYWVIFNDNI